MSEQIHLDAPNIGELEKKYLNQAVDAGYVSTIGPFVNEFEEEFAAYLGVEKAVSVQSGTAALHMALYQLGIGPGDEVIVPALTFVATVNPVIYVGAKPVFVDVDIKTWNISPAEIEKHITPKTKAIIPVHFYGNPCDMQAIMDLAKKYNLYLIEDATESLGAQYKGIYAGSFGDYAAFSFNGNKIITTGGGGMLAGRHKDRLKEIKFLINQARDRSNGYYHSQIGFNYRMTNIEAALGLAQMKQLGRFLSKKRAFNSIYQQELKDIEFISFQEEYEAAESSWWMSCILFEKEVDIEKLQEELKARRIPSRRIFTPVIDFPPYKKYRQQEYKNSRYIYERGLSLPSSTLNCADDIYYVCKVLRELI